VGAGIGGVDGVSGGAAVVVERRIATHNTPSPKIAATSHTSPPATGISPSSR
jgi:hypothetical protein